MTATPDVPDNLMRGQQATMFDLGPRDGHVLNLADRFIVPPFSILDARSGVWLERKRRWMELGLRSQDGRTARAYAGGNRDAAELDPVSAQMVAIGNGQSVFDPVLCEVAYRWFCPDGGRILDPYAGGSVRGLVAGYTGRRYTGIDLRPEQVAANEAQLADWLTAGYVDTDTAPTWVTADSWAALNPWDVPGTIDPGPYDLVFSCPPYHDLEVYSDHPDDLSNMPWGKFAVRYRETIMGAVDLLADDRFAVMVIGEIRGRSPGYYRNLMGATIDAFEAAGAAYYNEMIIAQPVGTIRMVVAKQFTTSRKIGKTHQTALVFVKGDPRAAAQACTAGDGGAAVEAAVRAAGTSLADLGDD